jgi:hypothetical protein
VTRLLTFSTQGYGATTNAGTTLAATSWLFAEGATAGGRQTFLTVLNPGKRSARVTALLYDTAGHLLAARTITIDPLHRGTMRLNDTLQEAAFATQVSSDVPVVVERPFYLGNPNAVRVGASLVFGRNGPGMRWSFPAGDTTQGGEEDLLVLNPNPRLLTLRATFYLASGQVVKREMRVPGLARATLHVNDVAGLAGTEHGVQLSSTNGQGFVAEQTIYNSSRTTVYGTAGVAQ